jgi:hypothetical protein
MVSAPKHFGGIRKSLGGIRKSLGGIRKSCNFETFALYSFQRLKIS